MNRRRGLRLFTVVAGLMLAWTLTVILPRARPPAKIEGPSGPSAVEEGWQNRPTPVPAPPATRPKANPRAIARHRTRSPAKPAADAPGVKGPRKPQETVEPSRTSVPFSPETRNLDEATGPPLEGRPADVPPPAGLSAETTGSGLAPPPPPPAALTPPVLLTEPTQESGDQQVILERGQLTSQLRLDAREGRVVLRILVRADGSVAQAEVARSSGQNALDQAALMAVSSWRFDPATRDGAPIDAWVLIPVRFVVR